MVKPTVLVIRLSAMGDVALSLPVISSIASDTGLIVVTRPLFTEFFRNIDNVRVISADTKGIHKGIPGLFRLCREIRAEFDIKQVIDLHDVIRSRLISFIFRFSGSKIYRINKGRKEKRKFLRTRASEQLIHSADRYINVFRKAGFDWPGLQVPAFSFTNSELSEAADYLLGIESGSKQKRVAFAPKARHATKEWPAEHSKKLIKSLGRELNVRVYLFGAKDEREQLLELAEYDPSIIVVAGRFQLRSELALLSMMDLMISMDSSNMHLAATAGVSTVSIWGGTHHKAGFGPAGNQAHIKIGIDTKELDCRPCTIYGKGDCKRSDLKFKCLVDISPERVINEIKEAKIL
ncbi:MAG: glycosyltransferase family 9 protein [Bacteroidales bacterium]|nr:glycosyltransferase family 9 protein [Bacteroidales bacterium]